MTAAKNAGELWRLPHSDAVTLRSLLKAVLPEQCWSFGGALLWDVQTTIPDKRANLRQIDSTSPDAVDITGDFGHAFAEEAEIRWKRHDDGSYDILVLAEGTLAAVQQFNLTQIIIYPTVVAMRGKTAMFLSTPAAVKARGQRARLDCNEYHAQNGAVQFLRCVRYFEEPVFSDEG